MSNSEALDILQKELEHRNAIDKSVCHYTKRHCPYNATPTVINKALEVAIEALELCVMIEDDGH